FHLRHVVASIGLSGVPMIHSSSSNTRLSFSQWLMALSTRRAPVSPPRATLGGISLPETRRVARSFIRSLQESAGRVRLHQRSTRALSHWANAHNRYSANVLSDVRPLTNPAWARAALRCRIRLTTDLTQRMLRRRC